MHDECTRSNFRLELVYIYIYILYLRSKILKLPYITYVAFYSIVREYIRKSDYNE